MEPKRVSWSREQREAAKQNRRTLFAIAVDSEPNVAPGVERFYASQLGAVPHDVAMEMFQAVTAIYKGWFDSEDRGKRTAKRPTGMVGRR